MYTNFVMILLTAILWRPAVDRLGRTPYPDTDRAETSLHPGMADVPARIILVSPRQGSCNVLSDTPHLV